MKKRIREKRKKMLRNAPVCVLDPMPTYRYEKDGRIFHKLGETWFEETKDHYVLISGKCEEHEKYLFDNGMKDGGTRGQTTNPNER